jgi:hypothetical protein
LRSHEPGSTIEAWKAHARIFQIHRLHELMKRHVSVEAGHPGHCWNSYPRKCRQRLATKTGETEIEPHHVGLKLPDCAQQTPGVGHAVKRPAPNYFKSVQLRLRLGKIISQNGERKTGNFLQLEGEVIPVFVQSFSAGRKRGYKTDIHY